METSSKSVLTQFLLADYQYRSQALWKSEEAGETRVRLFIAFAAAVGGGLGVLIKDAGVRGAPPLRLVVLSSLFTLLVLGAVTLMRMITRNEHTDKCKRGLDVIRQVFKDRFDDEAVLVNYYPVELPDIEASQIGSSDQKRHPWWRAEAKIVQPRKFGGLAHTTAVVNSLIAGAMTITLYPGTVLDPATVLRATGSAFAVMVVIFWAQLAYITHREFKTRKKLHIGDPTHAGGVVFRKESGNIEYLLVASTNDPQELVLPKGHIEQGEGHAEAALREVREETGAVARLIGLVASDVQYKTSTETVNAKFYLMEFLYQQQAKERHSYWSAFDSASASLKHPESRYALLCAEKRRAALFAS
jgi:ADP-ribose pyrophosphatase YjhB (NUDIX family)